MVNQKRQMTLIVSNSLTIDSIVLVDDTITKEFKHKL